MLPFVTWNTHGHLLHGCTWKSKVGYEIHLHSNLSSTFIPMLWRNIILMKIIHLQCRYLIPAPNAWAARAICTTARPIATQFPGHECMENLRAERSFDLLVMWVIGVLDIFFDMVFVQPGIARRSVDCCGN